MRFQKRRLGLGKEGDYKGCDTSLGVLGSWGFRVLGVWEFRQVGLLGSRLIELLARFLFTTWVISGSVRLKHGLMCAVILCVVF